MVEFLYHGTRAAMLPRILKHGLRYRKPGKIGTYSKATSGAGRIYLSDSYSLYYAGNATKAGALVVLRFRLENFNPARFVADEDWLAGWCNDTSYMIEREDLKNLDRRQHLRWCRDHLAFKRPDLAMQSLEEYGTIAYRGGLRPHAIDKIAIVSMNAYAHLIMSGYDPVVSQNAYSLLGNYYRGWLDWLFDESASLRSIDTPVGLKTYPGVEARVGIEIIDGPRPYTSATKETNDGQKNESTNPIGAR